MGLSAAISIAWFITAKGTSRFEPAVATLGFIVGLTGSLAERHVAAQERRHVSLKTLMDELRRDALILDALWSTLSQDAPRPRVYPRLLISAADATLLSGALDGPRDAELIQRLHSWREEANGFNRRLDLTEIRIFTARIPAELTQLERVLYCSDGYLNKTRNHIRDLQNYLIVNYQIVSSVHNISSVDDSLVPPERPSPSTPETILIRQ